MLQISFDGKKFENVKEEDLADVIFGRWLSHGLESPGDVLWEIETWLNYRFAVGEFDAGNVKLRKIKES